MGKYDVGNIFKTKEGYNIKIIEYLKNEKRKVMFLDDYSAIVTVSCTNILTGSISNPYHKTVYGMGYFGEGEYKAKINGKNTGVYICWSRLIERIHYKDLKKLNSYKNVSICDEWLNFQNFAKWYHNNKPVIENVNFEIDKDLLQQNIINKIYSPNTCVFLPYNVNIFLSKKELKSNNSFTGVTYNKKLNKFIARCTDFESGKRIYLGLFNTSEQAYDAYKSRKDISIEQVKKYLISLNYLSEDIIELIK